MHSATGCVLQERIASATHHCIRTRQEKIAASAADIFAAEALVYRS